MVGALVLVREHRVGLVDLCEQLLGGVARRPQREAAERVGMEALRSVEVGALDLVRRSPLRNAQHLVMRGALEVIALAEEHPARRLRLGGKGLSPVSSASAAADHASVLAGLAAAAPESTSRPLMHSHWKRGSSGSSIRARASATVRPGPACGVTASPGQNVFSAKTSRSNSGLRVTCSCACACSQGRATTGFPRRRAASSTSATGLARMSGTPFTASSGFCSNL